MWSRLCNINWVCQDGAGFRVRLPALETNEAAEPQREAVTGPGLHRDGVPAGTIAQLSYALPSVPVRTPLRKAIHVAMCRPRS